MEQQVAQANGIPEGENAAALGGGKASETALSQHEEERASSEEGGATPPHVLVEAPAPASAGADASCEASPSEECERQAGGERPGDAQITEQEASRYQELQQGEESAAAEVGDKLAALQLGGGALATPGGKAGVGAAADSTSRGGQEDDSIKAHVPPSLAAATVPSTATLASGSRHSKGSTASCRTFTAPPKCLQGRPRLGHRLNYSHSQQRVRQILRDNQALVKRLGDIAYARPAHEEGQQAHDTFMANVSASLAARRQGEAAAVMRQNLRIYQRLQEVKPSRDVDRRQQEKDFARHEQMLVRLAALRARGGGGSWVK